LDAGADPDGRVRADFSRAVNNEGVAMMRTVLIAVGLTMSLGVAAAQDQVPGNNQVPGNKSEAASPAPAAQQNAPPDKVAPGPSSSVKPPPDAKAEGDAPALKLDSATETKSPGSDGNPGGEAARSRP
jgi:hypothetical protein